MRISDRMSKEFIFNSMCLEGGRIVYRWEMRYWPNTGWLHEPYPKPCFWKNLTL